MNYFLDTSYILALEIANDQNHHLALQHWQKLKSLSPFLVTTSYVFDEVVTFLNSRNFHSKAVNVGNQLLYSREIQFIQVEQDLFTQAWEYLQKYDDKSYSFTDCISFLIMQKFKLTNVVTFDNHFSQARFQNYLKIPYRIDDKIWIQRDGIGRDIANDLLEVGISKNKIFLAFHPEHIRL